MKRNPSQQRAIAHLSGPMMVLAGPGSGKTSVIVERTAYMTTEGGISPSNILVVTFSRAAAKEMKERFLNFTGQEYTPITFGTFHGVFYGILKQAYGFTAANILSVTALAKASMPRRKSRCTKNSSTRYPTASASTAPRLAAAGSGA